MGGITHLGADHLCSVLLNVLDISHCLNFNVHARITGIPAECRFVSCRIKKLLTEKKAKSERENGLIYHQKQPEVRRNSQNISGLLTKPEV